MTILDSEFEDKVECWLNFDLAHPPKVMIQ